MKRSFIKRFTFGFTVMLLAIVAVVSVSGLTVQFVETEHSITRNSIQAGFAESNKGCGEYGTNTKKVLKRCCVRLIEGDYDSGRQFSIKGAKTGGTRFIKSPKISKGNVLGVTCYTTYDWRYYN